MAGRAEPCDRGLDLLAEPQVERLPVLRALIERLREGYQVAIALGEEVNDRSRAYIWLASVYFQLYYALTGREVSESGAGAANL